MGAPLRALPSGRVALLFSDIEGSTALLNRLGEAYGELLDQHDQILRAAFAEFDGHEFSNEGDAFGAAFAEPEAAAAAASTVQRGIAAAAWPQGEQVRVRIGLHLGEPKIRGHDYWGEDVHFAARICSAAHGGQVVMSAAMRAAIPDELAVTLGHHGLKDFQTPRELFQLVTGDVPEQFPPPRTLSGFRSNLPSIAAPLIGREDALADLAGLFDSGSRLVTLTGAGGMGKTRLAVAFGEQMTGSCPDGVAFVALAAVDGANVAGAVAEATGTPRGGDVMVGVLEHLRPRRMLIVLDNCEHVLDAASALISAVLERCPHVGILATSQLPLELGEEVVQRLDPLVGSAVDMFIDRARSHDRAFEAGPADRERIGQLCALLDGLPLAIVLAAARVRVLGVERLLAALQQGLEPLGGSARNVPDRHRSIRAALDWTVSLLASAERDTFIALGAFASSWSLEEAERLLAQTRDELEVWDDLTRLLDASLVVVRGDGRFAMPQRVRQHAAELLDTTDEADIHRHRHAEVVGLEIRELGLGIFVDYRRMLANVVDLLPEARHALAWSRDRSPASLRHLVGLMAPALARTGNLATVAADLSGFTPPTVDAQDYDDASICYAHGLLHAMQWSTATDTEVDLYDRARRGFALHGDPREVVSACYMSLVALEVADRRPEMEERFADLRAAGERVADARWGSEVARWIAWWGMESPTTDQLRQIVDAFGIGGGDFSFDYPCLEAMAASNRGDLPATADWYAVSLRQSPRDQLYLVLNGIKGVAWLLARLAQDDLSAELRAGVNQIYRARTGSDHGDLVLGWATDIATSEARLSEQELAAARSRGAALTYDELVDRALELADRFGSGDGRLTLPM